VADASSEADSQRDAWKRELLRLAAAGNRGFGAAPGSRVRLMELVELLEGSFSAPEAAASRESMIQGSWAVVFTTSPDLTSLDRLPLPGWRTARIGQGFEAGGGATNEIEFVSPLGTRVNQTVECSWKLTEPLSADMKVDLTFRGSSTRLASVVGLDLPVPAPPLSLPLPPATGVFKVSFLDGELLVQRTAAGGRGVNVLVREG